VLDWIAATFLVGHYALLSILCVFGLHRFYLTFGARRYYETPHPKTTFAELPHLTVQLPLYNEKYVANRLIDAAVALDYPRHLLQIQVLDDSTDETRELVEKAVAHYRDQGFDIEQVLRNNRTGYKAGAMAHAFGAVKGEIIAVFDADFVPAPNQLQKMIHYFTDPEIGMVQAQWDYLNRDNSLLTRAQGLMLDAHFGVEQSARYARNVFFNFNGTAGLWRKTAIEEAGGWHADTITEDLDLSYRAQLLGWKFTYLRDVRCHSELPANMSAYKTQQHRWTKGGIEVMLKLWRQIWRAPVQLRTRIEASLHLASNLTHLLILIDCIVFLIPAVMLRQNILPYPPLWVDLVMFCFGGLSHFYFYLSAQRILGRSVLQHLLLVPVLMSMTIGLSRSNGTGILEALSGHKSGFVRTPKLGTDPAQEKSSAGSYFSRISFSGDLLECALGGLYLFASLWCIVNQVYLALPFLLMFTFGFLYTGTSSLRERHGQSSSSSPDTKTGSPVQSQLRAEETAVAEANCTS